MSEATIREIEFAPGRTMSIETGRLAKQADGSVVVRQGDTMVLCTAVMSRDVRADQDFFPLTVDYREKFSAGGKIPGGFIKREGRSTDKEITSSRLIDRCVRPLFPDGFYHEVQIIAFVISADEKNDADVLAGVGASAALLLAGMPFDGPFAKVRVGRVDGEFVINPTMEETAQGDIDLIVAGKEDAIIMVEGEMKEIGEEDLLEALDLAHAAIKKLCQAQHDLVADYGKTKPVEYTTVDLPEGVVDLVREQLSGRIKEHLRLPYDKETFYGGIRDIKDQVVTELFGEDNPELGQVRAETTDEGYTVKQVRQAVGFVEKQALRDMILDEGRRIDGRGPNDIRDIWVDVGYLPRVHGSAIFTRGETQVLASVTLGSGRDVQAVDQIFDNEDKRFFLHYMFPPFSVGEARFLRGASRREIGHGMLAERAIEAVLPDHESFPYTIRLNADVLESNGSSSMASVCSGSLALMDAGVPLKKPVAGIAMGLIAEGDRTAVLTDILGTEDHLGDMDFKLTGTRDGITACQMDIKMAGLTRDILRTALERARDARLHILEIMDATLPEAREELSPYAPRLTQLAIDAEFIGAVIGPGGKIIQGIQRDTNTSVEIEEREGKGYITIGATNQADAEAAIAIIKGIVTVPEAGEVYDGTVKNIQSFGAIVEILPGKEGLLHISELDHGYVERVEDYVQVGDKIKVQLIEVRDDGRLRLSRKPFLPAPENGQGSDGGGRGDGGARGEGGRGDGGGRRDGGRGGRSGGNRGGGNRGGGGGRR